MYGEDWNQKVTDPKLRYDAVFSRMNDMTARELEEGRSAIYDSTNLERKFRDGYRKMAEEAGAACVLVYVKTQESIAKERAMLDSRGFQSPTMTQEKIAKHKSMLELPGDDEPTIYIDGEKPFDEQLASFREQLEKLLV